MSHLHFATELVEPILDGETWIIARWDVDRDIAPGETISAFDEQDRLFAELDVVHVTPMPAARFVELVDLLGGHRAYKDVHELLDELEGDYAPNEFTPSTTLHVIFFDVSGVAVRRGVIQQVDGRRAADG